MNESEMRIVLHAALIALADRDIAKRVKEILKISDEEIHNLQYKIYLEI